MAYLPQKKYLTYASLIQVQLPDPRIGKEHVTCAPVLVEVDKELRSRSEAYLLTHLLQTSLVSIAWVQAWVSQPKHTQLLQVALIMKNKWQLLLPSPSRHHTSLSRHATLSCFPGDCMLLFNAMPMGWMMAWTTKLRKYTHVHNTAKLLQMKEHALSLNIQMTNI